MQIGHALETAGLNGYHIEILFQNGQAVLRGSVGTPDQAQAASRVAQSVPGVQAVNNQLRVGQSPQQPGAARDPRLAMAAYQQQQMAQMQGAGGMNGMSQMMKGGGNQPANTQVSAPVQLGPKQPGKIRIGVAPPDAQMGQGNNAGADYSTPIRNAGIALMSGPAVEIAPLDSHIPMQLQAEAQQKQCERRQ